MKKIALQASNGGTPLILVFAEGTVLKPKAWFSLYSHRGYVPIGAAVEKIMSWRRQGAEIIYCTSRRGRQAEAVAGLLRQYGFEGAYLVVREHGEAYRDIVERIRPAILVEDDCRSIGGAWQMCITKVRPKLRHAIISVVVPEFKGIDHLPDNPLLLKQTQKATRI